MEKFDEEAPTNAIGGGNIAGAGIGPSGEPGVGPRAMRRYKRKNQQQAPRSAGRKTFSQFVGGMK